MCSTYILKPLSPFFVVVASLRPIYMQILLASAVQFNPGKMKCLHARSSTNLCMNIGGKKVSPRLKGHWKLHLAQHIAMNHRTRYMFSLVCAEQLRACRETSNLLFSLTAVPPVIWFLLLSAEITLHNCKKKKNKQKRERPHIYVVISSALAGSFPPSSLWIPISL